MTKAFYPSYASEGEIRAAAVLTNLAVVAETWGVPAKEQVRNIEATYLVLDCAFTIGSLTSASLIVEYSDDGTNWYQHTSISTTAGESSVSEQEYVLDASGSYSIAVPIIKHPYMRVSAIGTGTVTGSSLAISARFIT